MGLDQYLYATSNSNDDEDQIELGYRRKHFDLQDWMCRLWCSKVYPDSDYKYDEFNGVELELTKEDIDKLEHDILNNLLTYESADWYKDNDLEFITQARSVLADGYRIFYNSSW